MFEARARRMGTSFDVSVILVTMVMYASSNARLVIRILVSEESVRRLGTSFNASVRCSTAGASARLNLVLVLGTPVCVAVAVATMTDHYAKIIKVNRLNAFAPRVIMGNFVPDELPHASQIHVIAGVVLIWDPIRCAVCALLNVTENFAKLLDFTVEARAV